MGPLGQRAHSDHLGNIGHDDPDDDDNRLHPLVAHAHGDDEKGEADRESDGSDLEVEEEEKVKKKEILTSRTNLLISMLMGVLPGSRVATWTEPCRRCKH